MKRRPRRRCFHHFLLTVLVEEESPCLLIVKSLELILDLLVTLVEVLELVIHELLDLQLVLYKSTEHTNEVHQQTCQSLNHELSYNRDRERSPVQQISHTPKSSSLTHSGALVRHSERLRRALSCLTYSCLSSSSCFVSTYWRPCIVVGYFEKKGKRSLKLFLSHSS